MNASYFFAILLCFALGACRQEITSEIVLERAIQAHGGLENWENIAEISYEKKSILLDSLGAKESETTKVYRTVFSPEFFTEMQWQEDSTTMRVRLKRDPAIISMSDSVINVNELQDNYKKELQGAHYVYWQPYNLLNEDAVKQYVGKQQLENNDMQVVKVTYPDDSNSNTWWYFFDAETYLLKATMVEHGSTFSLIENETYETKSGLSLNARRSSYRTNKARKKQFLRAQYSYNIIDIVYK